MRSRKPSPLSMLLLPSALSPPFFYVVHLLLFTIKWLALKKCLPTAFFSHFAKTLILNSSNHFFKLLAQNKVFKQHLQNLSFLWQNQIITNINTRVSVSFSTQNETLFSHHTHIY